MNKRTSIEIFKSVVLALFLREVQTRFGTKKMGYFWAIFDAMFMVLMFTGIRSLTNSQTMLGIDYPVFLATGFLAYNLWRNIVSQSMNAFDANQALFVYKQVKPFDTVITRVLLELFVSVIATLIFLGIGLYLGIDVSVKNFNMVIFAVIWLCIFAFSIGLMSAVFAYFYEFYAKVVGVLMMPLMFASAIFYSLDSLPPLARDIIVYNPLANFIEMIHAYYFYPLTTQYVNYEYMLYWTVIPLWIGLFFYIRAEKRILSS